MSNLQDRILEVNVLFCFIYLKLHCDIAMWLLGAKIKHIMAERTYNGFTNRETWLVNVFYRESILEEGDVNLIEGNLECVKEHIQNSKLPFNIKKYFSLKNLNKILYFMTKDKKNNSDKINLILLKKIGYPIINKKYTKNNLSSFLKKELIN